MDFNNKMKSLSRILTEKIILDTANYEYKESINYNDLVSIYNTILENFKDVIISLEINNPLEIMEIFNYCLKSGILSVNHEFETKNDTIIRDYRDLMDLAASPIIEGYGCCRNISPYLKDLLLKFDIESKVFLVKGAYDFNTLDKNQLEKYQRQEEQFKIFQSKIPYKVPNHMLTYARYNKKNYILDPTNNSKVISSRGKLKSFHRLDNNITTYNMEVLPFANYIYKYASYLDVFKYRYLCGSEEAYSTYIKMQERLIKKCNDNEEKFNELYIKNKPLYLEYIKELNNVRNIIYENSNYDNKKILIKK